MNEWTVKKTTTTTKIDGYRLPWKKTKQKKMLKIEKLQQQQEEQEEK